MPNELAEAFPNRLAALSTLEKRETPTEPASLAGSTDAVVLLPPLKGAAPANENVVAGLGAAPAPAAGAAAAVPNEKLGGSAAGAADGMTGAAGEEVLGDTEKRFFGAADALAPVLAEGPKEKPPDAGVAPLVLAGVIVILGTALAAVAAAVSFSFLSFSAFSICTLCSFSAFSRSRRSRNCLS